ncbi:MAG: acyl carrier protein [SAR324 cluster bacterium]|nr:acyl carrier protein [SAR324 cluster bacterium]
MHDQIVDIIIREVEEVNKKLPNRVPVELRNNAPLFGTDGALDSIGLVTLLVAIEQSVEDDFDSPLTLADERAMSQKNSPYQTIGTLAKYIESLLGGSHG